MYILDPLFEKVEDYAKTSFELYRLKTINKSANVISSIVYGGIVITFLSLFFFIVNIGIAIWLGEVLGKLYYGFLCVGGFYGVIGIIVYLFMHKAIKRRISKSIISQLLN